MTEWQPIETKPKDHFPVLIDGLYGIHVAFEDISWCWYARGSNEPMLWKPTHWKPLPAGAAMSAVHRAPVENAS